MDLSSRQPDRTAGIAGRRPWRTTIEANGRSLELVCFETFGELAGLEAAWRALEKRSPDPFGYFQSFDWCMTWCRSFLTKENDGTTVPMVYTLWQGGDCVMLWPLMKRRAGGSLTVLLPLTAPMNQYTTVLYDAACVDLSLARAVLDAICRHGGPDAVCFDHVPQNGLLGRLLAGRGYTPGTAQQSSIMDLTGIPDWDSHHRALPKKQRLQRNSRRNRLEKLGRLDYRVLVPGEADYDAYLALCLALKQDWLRDTGRFGSDVFDPRFAAFLAALGHDRGEEEGRVFLHALLLDDTPIALEIGMRFRQDYYCFLGAIDLALQKHSPGKVQMESAQRWAIETGIRRFDFLNDPSTYKSSWTNTTEPLVTCYLPLTSLGHLYCRHWKLGLRPRLRAIFHGVGPEIRKHMVSAMRSINQLIGRNAGPLSLVFCAMP